jgi:predicted ABC-type sugar transport system permease subunit
MIEASMLGAGDSTLGDGYELRTIAAVVIGGASLSGGQGTIIGTLIGALIMGVIKDGCILLKVSFFWQLVVISLLIIVAVAFDMYQRRRTGA